MMPWITYGFQAEDSVAHVASMRPRHDAVDHPTASRGTGAYTGGFNEATA